MPTDDDDDIADLLRNYNEVVEEPPVDGEPIVEDEYVGDEVDVDEALRDIMDHLNQEEESEKNKLETVGFTGSASEAPLAADLVIKETRQIKASLDDDIPEDETLAPQDPLVDIRRQFERMEAISSEVVDSSRSDRNETQGVIGVLRGEIDKAIAAGQTPARVNVEFLVKALEVKTSINTNLIKIIDATAKMLASTKASTILQTNVEVTNNNSAELQKALDEPLGPNDSW